MPSKDDPFFSNKTWAMLLTITGALFTIIIGGLILLFCMWKDKRKKKQEGKDQIWAQLDASKNDEMAGFDRSDNQPSFLKSNNDVDKTEVELVNDFDAYVEERS